MKHSLLLALVSLSLFGCNGGMDPTLAEVKPEAGPITAEPTPTPDPSATPSPSATPVPSPTATPVPSPSPTPGPTGRSRIFVSRTLVTGIDFKNSYEKVCQQEAKKAKVAGKFTALVANTKSPFAKKYPVGGYIYQKAKGATYIVAKSYDDLIKGNNGYIFASADQQDISNSYKDLVWTGQKDFSQASHPDLNCVDWSEGEGYGIVGRMGRPGSDAIATQYQRCDIIAHLYCIEYQ